MKRSIGTHRWCTCYATLSMVETYNSETITFYLKSTSIMRLEFLKLSLARLPSAWQAYSPASGVGQSLTTCITVVKLRQSPKLTSSDSMFDEALTYATPGKACMWCHLDELRNRSSFGDFNSVLLVDSQVTQCCSSNFLSGERREHCLPIQHSYQPWNGSSRRYAQLINFILGWQIDQRPCSCFACIRSALHNPPSLSFQPITTFTLVTKGHNKAGEFTTCTFGLISVWYSGDADVTPAWYLHNTQAHIL